jgi:pyruvate formate lyase activating enzyme
MSKTPGINWIAGKCISCQACLLVCPSEALYLHKEKVSFDGSKCDSSFYCIQVCFTEALEMIDARVGSQ